MGDTDQFVGGSVIGSGGFGCVLRPPVRCKNDKDETPKGVVSKLMTTKHAKKEMNISTKFKSILRKIPDYKDYFILPKKICTPQTLKDEDKINFTLKCNTLLRKKITVDNINKKLDSLKIIQMQDGGMDLDVFLRNSRIDMSIFGKMNTSLEKLLAMQFYQ